METEGLKDRMGSVGNQFALTFIGFLMPLPFVFLREGNKLGEFVKPTLLSPKLATMTLKKTGAVTQSVANTAKRVIVIVGVAIVLGESLDPIKMLGCSIGIGGVFLYSIIDQLLAEKKEA